MSLLVAAYKLLGCGRDLVPLTQDQSQAPCIGSAESLSHWPPAKSCHTLWQVTISEASSAITDIAVTTEILMAPDTNDQATADGAPVLTLEFPWSYPHDRTCSSQPKDMDTDNTQAACCPALRLCRLSMLSSFIISWLSCVAVLSSFLPFPLLAFQCWLPFQALGSKH